MDITTTDLIGTKEACRILDVDKATISRWVHAGKLTPRLKLPSGNGAYLFARVDIERLKEAA
jgi:excisionase family DNA binding protein